MESTSDKDILNEIARYEHDGMVEGDDDPAPSFDSDEAPYREALDKLVRELQEKVQEQQRALDKLRASSRQNDAISEPSSDARNRLRQLYSIKSAYQSLTPMEPTFPPSKSPLPALLAIRQTQCLINETRDSINTVHDKISHTSTQIEQEEADLRDSRLINKSLQDRTERLRAELLQRSQKPPIQVANDLIKEEQKRKIKYERETKRLVEAYNVFIDDHLSAMLAAEDLGGPVVGDDMEVVDEMLEVGFSQKGRPNKLKAGAEPDDQLRQQKIDDLWGATATKEDGESGQRTERGAAGAEIRSLTENLLNFLFSENSSPYFPLERESAAARFLVRAKIAQFNPKDAKQIRLIDFGKQMDQ
ncbi:MAG: hypothetical protein M1819_002712 [Sarea resinae]|nr:MAG: hypothetical protein M1819_002712 [Sarea resinae]